MTAWKKFLKDTIPDSKARRKLQAYFNECLHSVPRKRDLGNFLVEANRHLKNSEAVTVGIDVQRDGAHVSKPVYLSFRISKN